MPRDVSKVYVGGLPNDATSEELEDVFNRYGKLRKVWVARRPPGFAFIEFEDGRDAEDAVRALNGQRICGVRARVELSSGQSRGGGRFGGGDRERNSGYMRGYEDRYNSRGGGRGRSRSRSPRRSRTPPPRGSPRYDDRKRSASRSRSRSRSRSGSR